MATEDNIPFTDLLQQYRCAAHLTQEDLAERARLGVRTIGHLEGGTRHPRRTTLALLAEALGLSAEQRVHLQAAAQRSVAALEVSPASPHISPLPLPLTRLIGRDQELVAVQQLILHQNARLVTLTGMAGIGKTRLALSVAWQIRPHFPDGVYMVPLAPVQDWHLLPASIAQVLDVPEERQQSLWDGITSAVANKRLLLLLDNLEHLLEGGAFIADLLSACPCLVVLVTSRAALRVRGEHRFPVSPLASTLPDPDGAGIGAAEALFLERAQEVRPDFRLTASNTATITAICRRLEGIPLAIELAAMRVPAFSLTDLLHHLEHRLSALVAGPRDLPARQQTMRDAVAWSYGLLSSREQMVFRRLAIFVGGWTLMAAQALCDVITAVDLLHTFAILVDANLIQFGAEDEREEPRYTMLEILREYGLERLETHDELADMQRCHAKCMLTLAKSAEEGLRGPQEGLWLARLDQEQGNLRAALHWAQDQDSCLGLALVAAIWWYWYARRYLHEGLTWIKTFLTRTQGQAEMQTSQAQANYAASILAATLREYKQAERFAEESYYLYQKMGDEQGMSLVLSSQGASAYFREQYEEAEMYYQQALTISHSLGDKERSTIYLTNLANIMIDQGRFAEAQTVLEESLAYRRELGNQYYIAVILIELSNILCKLETYTQAINVAQEALSVARESGNRRLVASALDELGKALTGTGDYYQAITMFEQSRLIYEELQDVQGIAPVLRHMGDVTSAQGEWEQAEGYYRSSIALFQQAAMPVGIAKCLTGWARALVAQNQMTRAAYYAGKAAALLSECNISLQAKIVAHLDQIKQALQDVLSHEAFQTAWEQGQTLSIVDILRHNDASPSDA